MLTFAARLGPAILAVSIPSDVAIAGIVAAWTLTATAMIFLRRR